MGFVPPPPPPRPPSPGDIPRLSGDMVFVKGHAISTTPHRAALLRVCPYCQSRCAIAEQCPNCGASDQGGLFQKYDKPAKRGWLKRLIDRANSPTNNTGTR